jgi:DNA-binding transcriptional regulator YiaG
MTRQEFRTLRQSMGLSANECAQLLRVYDGSQIRSWERGRSRISGPVAVAMELLYDQWWRARLEQHRKEAS